MKKTWKPILSLLLALCITVSTAAGAIAIGRASAADGAANWLLKNVAVDPADQEPDNIVDWAAFVLARGGYQIDGDYLQYIDGVVRANFSQLYLSDYARIALAVAAAGGDARNVGGHDLIEAIAQTDFTREIYTDGVSFALLAMDSMRYELPETVRKAAVDALCSAQREDGGFNYALRVNPEDPYSVDGSIDTTGPVLAALAPYQTEEKTAGVIERALAFLKANQNVETAGFGFMGSDSAETISMAIVGLTALRIDPCGPEYVKNGKTMLDALLTFVNPDGGMRAWDGSSNSLTTYQSLSALEAYARFVENGTAFYDLSDLTREPESSETASTAEPTALPTTQPQTDSVQESGTEMDNPENPSTGSGLAVAGIASLALLSAGALMVSRKRMSGDE